MTEKMSLAALIQEVTKDMPEPYETGKVLTAVRAKLATLPQKQHPKGVVDAKTISCRLWEFRKKRESANGQAAPKAPTPTVATPPPDSYTKEQIATAAAFLRSCGGALHKAGELLKAISLIFNKVEES